MPTAQSSGNSLLPQSESFLPIRQAANDRPEGVPAAAARGGDAGPLAPEASADVFGGVTAPPQTGLAGQPQASRSGRHSRHAARLVDIPSTPEFQALRRRHRRFVFPASVLFLLWYLAFVTAAAFFPAEMRISVFGPFNVGFLLAFSQFLATGGMTWWYCHFAKTKIDPAVDDIRKEQG